MFTAFDGSTWNHGIRYFYAGGYHKEPPEVQRRGAAVYHVFAPVDPTVDSLRLYTLHSNEPHRADAEELARRFGAASWASRTKYEPSERKPW